MFIKPYQLRNLKRKFMGYTGAGAGVLALKEGKRLGKLSVLKNMNIKVRSKRKRVGSVTANHGRTGTTLSKRKKTSRKTSSKFTRTITKTVRKAIEEQDSSISTYRKIRFGELRIRNLVDGAGVKGLCKNFSKISTPLDVASKNLEFVYFNQLKMADATAILYNGKTQGGNWIDIDGNFPAAKSLKTRIAYMGVHLKVKNMCPFPFDVNIHVFTAKNNTADSPLESYKAQKAVNTNIQTAYTNHDNGLMMELTGKIEDLPLPDFSRNTIRYKNVVPGQELVWSHSISDYYFDESKLRNTAANLVRYTRGSKVLVFEFIPSLVACNGTIEGLGSVSSATVGHPGTSDYSQYFGIQETEIYKIVQPEITDDAHEGHKVKLFTDTTLNGMAVSSVDTEYLSNPNVNHTNGHLG